MATAGVVDVRFASRTTPLSRTVRDGSRPRRAGALCTTASDIRPLDDIPNSPAAGYAAGRGSNQPIVRFDCAKTRRAAPATASALTAAMRAGASTNRSTLPIVSK
ncbi:MAG: hypothetical protein DMF93_00805 [Acidobacteria bacterium]|nr:MAG: hypothetical protein DMF93_00805 [Acidobacteriota bacterium]